MKNKSVSFTLLGIVIAGVIIFGGRRYYEPSVSPQKAEDSKTGERLQEKSLYDAVVIPAKQDDSEAEVSSVQCADAEKIRGEVDDGSDHFWGIPNTQGGFIAYAKKTKILTVCYEGKVASVKLPTEIASDNEEQIIRISPSFFTDLFDDGTREFLVFSGQCVEGPCIGSHYLYQLDGVKLRRLYKFRSDTVDLITEKDRRALVLDNNCYTYDFGVGFEYMTVAEAKSDGGLEVIPYSEIRSRYPQVLAGERMARTPEARPEERAQADVQKLIDDAYRGRPVAELLSAYDSILEKLPKGSSEEPGSRLKLNCDPVAKLKMIAGSENQ